MVAIHSTFRPKAATLNVAKNIFFRGTDCLGPEEIIAVHGKLHGLKLPKSLPPIPWTEDELKAAKEARSHLILVAPGLTMKNMVEARKNLATDGGKLLCNTNLYREEEFYTSAVTGDDWDWRLVGNEVLPGSPGQNYLRQTLTLTEALKNFPLNLNNTDLSPSGQRVLLRVEAAYQSAVRELAEKREWLAKLINDDWQAAAKQLTALKLNQLCRESPAVTLYRLITYEVVNHARLLQGMYHWSNTLSSDGGLVYVGRFDRGGAGVRGGSPGGSDAAIGVVLSRSAEVECGK